MEYLDCVLAVAVGGMRRMEGLYDEYYFVSCVICSRPSPRKMMGLGRCLKISSSQ